ncbi:hypothetical protein ACFX14_034003 [Malus domestica]
MGEAVSVVGGEKLLDVLAVCDVCPCNILLHPLYILLPFSNKIPSAALDGEKLKCNRMYCTNNRNTWVAFHGHGGAETLWCRQ